ncbi:MAG: methyltransferase domain-containing protein [Chloroflexi bacterium]|nr:methyltransferase domain-containing protein [Chloroflexota bacterium]
MSYSGPTQASFAAAVTQLYRELFPPGGCVLDLLCGRDSYLPPDVGYRRVVGLGLDLEELAANLRLDAFVVQNLDLQPRLPFDAAEFEAVALSDAVRLLAEPVVVLLEVGRVLRPGSPLAIAFFRDGTQARQVTRYLEAAGNWQDIMVLDRTAREGGDRLLAVCATAR